nr:PREDICTED: testicular haploid expressed gene protein isoform X3 [Latimeria chalumnae]|eukprot:XP_014346003.1 PREDICTED: testicular haploid expressed gene protein isoform X3 [Latimeria chalumnae]
MHIISSFRCFFCSFKAMLRERRIDQLAKPKRNFLENEDRRSIYWVDKVPRARPSTQASGLTRRQLELSKFKRINENFEADRPSPIWAVNVPALKAEASPRLQQLAHPKTVDREWRADRPYGTHVSARAKTAVCTPRVTQLARPKIRSSQPPQETCSEGTSGSDKEEVKTEDNVSDRIETLATQPNAEESYKPEKVVEICLQESESEEKMLKVKAQVSRETTNAPLEES